MPDTQDETEADQSTCALHQEDTHHHHHHPIRYPPAPNPSDDAGVIPQINAAQPIRDDRPPPEDDFDVATLDPIIALKMLSRGVQVLSDMTGDVPATPPVSRPSTPKLSDDQPPPSPSPPPPLWRSHRGSRPHTPTRVPSEDIGAATMNAMPIGSPEAHPSEPDETVDDHAVAKKIQYDALARKFYSKKPPPIPMPEYLLRLHRYCPMSTGVYLAAGAYIHRLAVEEKVVPVTLRTAHRLVLAALRVAMKALEDLNYPHQRFAGVGGVSEKELAKLEVSLCYLLNFDLRVDARLLYDKARELQKLAVTKSRSTGVSMRLHLPSRGARGAASPEPLQMSSA